MKNRMILCMIIIIINTLIVLPSISVYAGSGKILARVMQIGYLKRDIVWIEIIDNGKVKVFIPNESDGVYKVVKMPETKIDGIIDRLKNTGIADDKLLGRSYLYVDGDGMYIEVYSGGKRYYLISHHTLFEGREGHKNVVVTQGGPQTLGETENKDEYFKEHASDEYKRFRVVWDKCFRELNNLYLEITGVNIDLNTDLRFPFPWADDMKKDNP